MIEIIFAWKRVRERHKAAPLLRERERYLLSLHEQGFSRERLSTTANLLLQIIRILDLTELRSVGEEEIRTGAEHWAQDVEGHLTSSPRPSSAKKFRWCATHWLTFTDSLIRTPRPETPFFGYLADFIKACVQRGLAPVTVQNYTVRAENFLEWFTAGGDGNLALLRASDVAVFLEEKATSGYTPQSRATLCQALRTFFEHAESRGWCVPGIARQIKSPRLQRVEEAPRGPAWSEVMRLIRLTSTDGSADVRALPILLLCAIYGMRAIEVTRLQLEDIDWRNEILTIRRAKHGRVQQFPLHYEVGKAILRYLEEARPPCDARHVFTTRTRPFRPLQSQAMWSIVGKRMKRHGLKLPHVGTHSLRHACATELLRKGSSLQQIADFLGHRDLKSVSIYARHDKRLLRNVSAFSLAGIL